MNNPIQIYKKPKLTQGQKLLYGLICEKLKTNKPIHFREAKTIYIEQVCKDVRNGVVYWHNWWWCNEKDEQVGRYEPLPEELVPQRVLLWLTSNIGSLVLKGYLKVIPSIELQLK